MENHGSDNYFVEADFEYKKWIAEALRENHDESNALPRIAIVSDQCTRTPC
jgi:hypothetical protein